jgi:hypothetical protein
MQFTPRDWPATLVTHYRGATSLVVRLECALHPSPPGDETTEALEQAAVRRLEEALEERGRDRHDLFGRAIAHQDLAMRAYLKSRGEARCMVPRRRRGVDKASPSTAAAPVDHPLLTWGVPPVAAANDVHVDGPASPASDPEPDPTAEPSSAGSSKAGVRS